MPAEALAGTDAQRARARTVHDVSALLEYLGQRADSRLQAHFTDTRSDLAAPIRKLAAPPCRTYRHFLNRLVAIGGPLPGGRRNDNSTPAQSPGEPEGDEELDDLAFLYFSRDFLAAVAAPATVDTIRVTNAYVRARRHSLSQRLRRTLRTFKWRRGAAGSVTAADAEDECAAGASRLAFRVVVIEYGTIVLTLLTLAISAYAFAGHIILDRRNQILADYDAIGRDRVELVRQIQLGGGAIGDDVLSSSASCGRADGTSAGTVQEASLAPPSAPPAGLQRAPVLQLCALYWRQKHASEDIVGVNLHLVSWTQVVFSWRPLGDVFGVDQPFILSSANIHDEWCNSLHLKLDSNGHCSAALQDLIYRTAEVAESLLGSIALYVLPTLYGCLGAAAATLRTLRCKVDQSLVTMTDRGRVQQDVILGLLCGAIIALFAGYIGKGTAAEGLGLSALALLAGYNVSGMFAFLDELSNRVFRPAQAEHPAAH